MNEAVVTNHAHVAHDLTGGAFDQFEASIRAHFDATIDRWGSKLFVVETHDLAEVYLDALPPELRDHHKCSTCRHFFHRFGALAVITDTGVLEPAIWPDAGVPDLYAGACRALRKAVMKGKVTSIFLSGLPKLGTAVTGEWTHFEVPNPAIFRHALLSAGQAMAEKREHFGALSRALAEFTAEQVAQALTLLRADALYRTEKVIGPAEFLYALQERLAGTHKEARRNLIWQAVAGAPAGFCTPRSSMIGTLLDDIAAGLDFDAIESRFAAKMHPLQYQRPQTAASAGNIAQAEAIVAKMGIEPSLHRRFARIDEIETVWMPEPVELPATRQGGVFADLKPRDSKVATEVAMAAQRITWAKFSATVLPTALEMSLFVSGSMSFGAIVAAVHPDAPPILQWDREDRRNGFSGYTYHGGTPASQWGLPQSSWVRVTGISLWPSMWGGGKAMEHFGKSAMILLAGAVDTRLHESAIFPETLRSELHAVRKTIEQFSKSRPLEGADEASACGLIIRDKAAPHQLRVRSSIGTACYHIDRWD